MVHRLFLFVFVATAAAGSGPCCKTCELPLVKYFSTDAPHGFCGEACMDPAKFSIYKKFEANLTKATSANPCSEQWTPSNTKQYANYTETVTHGIPHVLSVTLDLYAPMGMPDHSCCDVPLFSSLHCVGIPGKPVSLNIFGTGPYCCPKGATESQPCGSHTGSQATHEQAWSDFKRLFGKVYESATEERRRFDIFKENLAYVETENAWNHSYELEVNKFADLSLEEFTSRYMGMSKPDRLFGDAPFLGYHEYKGEELPTSVDWRTEGAVTPVKNQGQCGSCWSFSATGALEGAWKIAGNRLESLSEQQFVDCDSGDNGCHGGLPGNAFTFATKNPICTERSYPYQAEATGSCSANRCTVGIPQGRVTGWKSLAKIPHISPASEADLMSAVAQQPVSVAIEADRRIFQLYKGGVLDGSCGGSIDHGVLVAGYGTDPKGGDYWLIKNSWGTDHGEQGYWRIKRGKSMARTGECAILTLPSYPIIGGSDSATIVV